MEKHRRRHIQVVGSVRRSFAGEIGADLHNRDHRRVYDRGHRRLEYLQQKGRLDEESYEGVVDRMRIAILALDSELGKEIRDMELNVRRRTRR